jgi:predicted ribosome quality control (RQC) complex YloA/Tae2 family protein
VLKIYQPDETTITLHFRHPGRTNVLLIAADALYPRLHTIEEQPHNPLHPPAFCMLLRKYLEPSRLLALEQQGFDRLVHLRFEAVNPTGQLMELTLVLELMGRQSNLYLLDQDGLLLDALKRFPERGIVPGKPYQPPFDQGKTEPGRLAPLDFADQIRLLPAPTPIWRWMAQTFQGFSKVAAQEVVRRAGLDPHVSRSMVEEADWINLHDALNQLLQELERGGTPTWYPDEPEDFAAYTLTGRYGASFASTDQLIRRVLGEKQREKTLDTLKGALRKGIARHRKRVEKKLALQQAELQQADEAHLYRHQGELLTASFHLLQQGASACQVPDYTQEGSPLVTIELDPRLSPSANIQRIFKRYAKAKASQTHTREQLHKTKLERRYLEDVLLQIDLADNERILKEIEGELQNAGYLKRREKRPSAKKAKVVSGPERYLSADGIPILVGRNNLQNDQLTFRFTGPNHLWLHARNIPGSHVSILSAGEIPRDTLLQAAQLAAFFSQSRHSPKVEVDYTLRKHVRKPKGAQPGFVHYDRAKTLVVDPTDFVWPLKQE